MTNPKFSDLLPVVFAFVVAIAVIALIKWGLVPNSHEDAGELSEIWKLEVFVISSLLTAFILNEILEIVQRILPRNANTASQHKPHGISPVVLVGSFGASVAIYLAASILIKNYIAT